VKQLFGAAAKALTEDEDEPQPQRRTEKDGDRDGSMTQFARRFLRLLGTKTGRAASPEMIDAFREARAALTQPVEDIIEAPGAYLSDLHDFASPFYSDNTAYAFDADSVAPHDHYSPHL
jgi:hypothetical protein